MRSQGINRFDLVVFDLDGTLVDSRRDLADSVNALLAELSRPPLSEALIGTLVGEGAKALVERALAASGVESPPRDALARYLAHYDRNLLVHTKPYAGVVEMLEALAERGIQRAVLTNKPQNATERLLEGLGLRSLFDAGVIGAEAKHPRKPSPAGLIVLAAQAEIPLARTLLVGDGLQDVETARRAETAFCAARYGFGFSTAEPVLLPSDGIIDSPMALLAFAGV